MNKTHCSIALDSNHICSIHVQVVTVHCSQLTHAEALLEASTAQREWNNLPSVHHKVINKPVKNIIAVLTHVKIASQTRLGLLDGRLVFVSLICSKTPQLHMQLLNEANWERVYLHVLYSLRLPLLGLEVCTL